MTIAKRIEKIEALIKAVPGAVLLREPPFNAPEAEFDEHAAKVSGSLLHETLVIVVRNGNDRLRRPGVFYVDDDFNGLLAMLGNSPATDGKNKDRLSQIISDAQGSVLSTVSEVRHGG